MIFKVTGSWIDEKLLGEPVALMIGNDRLDPWQHTYANDHADVRKRHYLGVREAHRVVKHFTHQRHVSQRGITMLGFRVRYCKAASRRGRRPRLTVPPSPLATASRVGIPPRRGSITRHSWVPIMRVTSSKDRDSGYSFSKPNWSNFRVRTFSLTMRTVSSGKPLGFSAVISTRICSRAPSTAARCCSTSCCMRVRSRP